MLGVACHVGFTLAQWNDGKVNGPLSRATFTSENKPLSVNCEVMFLFCSSVVSFLVTRSLFLFILLFHSSYLSSLELIIISSFLEA